ncbi:MAG TPA: 2-amino-4-hydroxy-6-hydroxymethyldihydropteridine diphosphokinase [Polyangiaceae bacterium]|jgi:2-amino-4-hydroxy-6-hydroxymethyldihydropteridine diphosphokinase
MLAVVGLGANLGDRVGALRAAEARVGELGVVRARSRVYETDPVDAPPPNYLNAAVALETELAPEDLMRALLAIEASMGRVRAEKNGPRTIDLDVLWIEGVALASEVLTVPHPRLTERAFALVPLLEVAPGARDPATGRAYAEIALDRAGIRAVP